MVAHFKLALQVFERERGQVFAQRCIYRFKPRIYCQRAALRLFELRLHAHAALALAQAYVFAQIHIAAQLRNI